MIQFGADIVNWSTEAPKPKQKIQPELSLSDILNEFLIFSLNYSVLRLKLFFRLAR